MLFARRGDGESLEFGEVRRMFLSRTTRDEFVYRHDVTELRGNARTHLGFEVEVFDSTAEVTREGFDESA